MTNPPHVVATLVSETWEKYDQLRVAHRRFSAPFAAPGGTVKLIRCKVALQFGDGAFAREIATGNRDCSCAVHPREPMKLDTLVFRSLSTSFEALCREIRTMAGGDTTIHAELDAQADVSIHSQVLVQVSS
jgi:hypothetical protein